MSLVQRDELYATVRDIWDASPDALEEEGVEAFYSRLLPLIKVTKEQNRKCSTPFNQPQNLSLLLLR